MPRSTILLLIALTDFGAVQANTAFVTLWHERNTFATLETTTSALGSGGFGASSKKKDSAKPKKKKKVGLQEFTLSSNKKDAPPLMDRFGFPIMPTENDIFPPLPADTELIPSSTNERIESQNELDFLLKNHVSVDLNALELISENQYQDKHRMQVRVLHNSPPVLSIDNFFTDEECQSCIDLVSSANSGGSMQINSATFSPYAQSKRTSTTWFMHYEQMTTLLTKLQIVLREIEVVQCEEPQIVRYKDGEEFSWHYDEVPAEQLSNGGQRLVTALVYLNTLNEQCGGGTVFRDLLDSCGNQVTMRPKRGSLLLFFPAFKNGVPDDRTLHKGEVVKNSQEPKMICQMWIHQKAYSPAVPKGNTHVTAIPKIHVLHERLCKSK